MATGFLITAKSNNQKLRLWDWLQAYRSVIRTQNDAPPQQRAPDLSSREQQPARGRAGSAVAREHINLSKSKSSLTIC